MIHFLQMKKNGARLLPENKRAPHSAIARCERSSDTVLGAVSFHGGQLRRQHRLFGLLLF